MAELDALKGVEGKRGPLKPPWDFRWTLAILFFVVSPLGAAACAAIISRDKNPWLDSFLFSWLSLMPYMWASTLGPFQGRRLVAAFGYNSGTMIGRLIELAVVAISFFGCGYALVSLDPENSRALFGPIFGAFLYILFGFIGLFPGILRR